MKNISQLYYEKLYNGTVAQDEDLYMEYRDNQECEVQFTKRQRIHNMKVLKAVRKTTK